MRPGWRNVAPSTKVFGVPSVRTDIPPPLQKSVADHQSYGDEMGAGELLTPPPYTDEGVTESDFVEARTPVELRAIFSAAGFRVDDATFGAAYALAAARGPGGAVSVDSMRRALREAQGSAVS